MRAPARLLTATAAALLAATAGLGVAVAQTSGSLPVVQDEPPLVPVPRAECRPGDVPEPGMQGRVPADDVAAGGAAEGYRCQVDVVGRHGTSGGFKVERYVDAAGRECAYYDTTRVFPSDVVSQLRAGLTPGVAVLDMSDPSRPVQTATLSTPAMLTPHESLLVNQRRGLVAAVAGNALFQAGQVDVYDASADCRTPVLRSSLPVGVLGHESGFSPDGNTFWAASLGGDTLTAIDLTDPARPRPVYVGNHATHAVTISDDGNRAYLAAGAGFPRNELTVRAPVDGLEVLDVSQVQSRQAAPEVTTVGALTWDSVTIPQAALPVTIGGRPYLVQVDEFAYGDYAGFDGIKANGERVGAARIIDISDETAPRVVSNLRLEVHQPESRGALAGDPGTDSQTGGYAGHYCAVPQREEPGIVACSFLASGLRVFDVRDPLAPREVAYFVAPVPPGGPANNALSSPAFSPERREVWYSDGGSGFWALRLSEQAWPQAAAAPVAPAPAAPAPAARALPATGLALPGVAALALLVSALAVRAARR
ncbi:MAG TPA: hypothetical protein VNU66_09850 [Mycobacteriales bacterium]|nr:hypothetical protein [Mycobacteriales bacterium]